MTYAVSHALQAGVFQRLDNDPTLTALVLGNVFDAPPSGTIPQNYVLIGDEIVRDRSTKTNAAAIHEFVISVVSDTAGFSTAKQVAGAVCDALIDADITLTRGTLTALNSRSAHAVREDSPGIRQIDLKFNAFVEDS